MSKNDRYIHSNKCYLALFYNRCEMLDEAYNDEEIGRIIRAAIKYELYGEQPDIKDRALMVMCGFLCKDIDIATNKANDYSEKQRQKALARHRRDLSAGMTEEEMDAEINSMFPRSKKA